MKDWTDQIGDITVTHTDDTHTTHNNPNCPNTTKPTQPTILWNHQTIRLPEGWPYTINRKPKRCHTCRQWEPPGDQHTWRPHAACRHLGYARFFPDDRTEAQKPRRTCVAAAPSRQNAYAQPCGSSGTPTTTTVCGAASAGRHVRGYARSCANGPQNNGR